MKKRITKANQIKRRRSNLMKQDSHCYWCRIEVVYYKLKRGETMPDNFATLDHLHTRYYPEVRKATSPEVMGYFQKVTVLACHKCNQERGDKETKSLNREALWERSGAYPKDHPKNRDLFDKATL